MADPDHDGAGGEFLRVQVMVDISRPLLRCCKLWSEGKLVGWVGIKYERLPNFCYWCGCVNHSGKECKVWLRGKGHLNREEQQYGAWMSADLVRIIRKTVAVIPGASRHQAPWRKQQTTYESSQDFSTGASSKTRSERGTGSTSGREEKWDDTETSNFSPPVTKAKPGCDGPISG